MFQMVPQILKTLVSEGQQMFTAKDQFLKRQSQLIQLIKDVSYSLGKVEEFQATCNRELYNEEQKQIIEQCKDFLHKSDQLIQLLPQNLTLKTNNYKEMTTCIEELQQIKQKILSIEKQTGVVFETIIQPEFKVEFDEQVVYEIELILKLKTLKKIQDIFDQYPRHLTTQYRLKISIDENDQCKQIHQFKRNDFLFLNRIDRSIEINTISRENHCTLEIRTNQKLQQKLKEPFLPNAQFAESEIFCGLGIEEKNIEVKKPSKELKLYIVAHVKGGVVIQRHLGIRHLVREKQSLELQVRDSIIILQESFEPQISFIVHSMMIKTL